MEVTLPTLAGLKAAGRCRYVGITGYNLGALRRVVEMAPPGAVDTVLSYCRLTLFNKGSYRIMPYVPPRMLRREKLAMLRLIYGSSCGDVSGKISEPERWKTTRGINGVAAEVCRSAKDPSLFPHSHADFADHFDFFKSRGVGLINASPVGMGILTTGSVPKWHPAIASTKETCSRAAKYAESRGHSFRM